MSNNGPSRDQQQTSFLEHAQQQIDELIPEELDELRHVAFDYASVMMIQMQLPSGEGTVRSNVEKMGSSFLVPFREEGQLALGMKVLEAINATVAQYGMFKSPGQGRG